ncbi:MAG: hypothetical protein IV086_04160 [Hyphomonadaceae bacterium]|nr:hypothetical protein [Hyphomonadaceae bacterium]
MSESRIKEALAAIQPGQRIVLDPLAGPPVDANRWFKVREPGEVDTGLFAWRNRPDFVPSCERHNHRHRSIGDIAPPHIQFVGRQDQLSDFYQYGDTFFISERVFQELVRLDPAAIDWLEVRPEGVSVSYYYCLPRRCLDAIAEQSTKVIVSSKAIFSGSQEYMTWVTAENDLFYVRSDVPSSIHCFVMFYRSGALWSRELVEATIKCGAKGIYFRPTSTNSEEQTIRI